MLKHLPEAPTKPLATQEYAKHLNSTYGWNVVPMYYLVRDTTDFSKKVKLIEWQQYKHTPYPLDEWKPEYKALSIMTGDISNLTIVDLDSQEAIDTLLNAVGGDVGELAEFVVQTFKGYQLFYTYEPNTTTRIGIKDKIDFLNGGVTFAVDCNEGYNIVSSNPPKAMPQAIRDLLLDKEHEAPTEDVQAFERALRENSDLPYKFPLHPILLDFIKAKRISGKVKDSLEKIFCTRDYKDYVLADFATAGQKHASMLYVAGIVASNPTVDENLYIKFLKHWAEKVAKIDLTLDKEQKLLGNRVKGGMNYFRYNAEWKGRTEELTNPVNKLKQTGFDAWFNPQTELFTFYNHESKLKRDVSRPSVKDMIAREFNREEGVVTYTAKDINVILLDERTETFDPTVDDTFFTDEYGKGVFNNFKRTPMLSYFKTCKPNTEMPDFIGRLIPHLFPNKEERELWLHSVAYHMKHLVVSPTTHVLTGKSGTGKNILMQTIMSEIYGDMHTTVAANTLTGKFRSMLKNKLFVFIDEVSEKSHKPADRGSLHNVIKQIVANPLITLETKGKDEETYPNHGFYTMASNKVTPFLLEEGFDRRVNIYTTNPTNLRQLEWFPDHLSSAEIDKLVISEVPAFVSYLASIQLDHKLWSKVIENKQRESLILASISDTDKYVSSIINKDVEALSELNHDFAEWYERLFITDGKSSCPVKDFKEQLGEPYTKVARHLKDLGVNFKKVNNIRSVVLNPKGSDNPFS